MTEPRPAHIVAGTLDVRNLRSARLEPSGVVLASPYDTIVLTGTYFASEPAARLTLAVDGLPVLQLAEVLAHADAVGSVASNVRAGYAGALPLRAIALGNHVLSVVAEFGHKSVEVGAAPLIVMDPAPSEDYSDTACLDVPPERRSRFRFGVAAHTTGWAFDPAGERIDHAGIVIDQRWVISGRFGFERRDVAEAFGNAAANSGFEAILPTELFGNGEHIARAFALTAGGTRLDSRVALYFTVGDAT